MPLIARATAQVIAVMSTLCLATHVALLLAVGPAQRDMAVVMLLMSLACLACRGRPIAVAGAGAAMVVWHLAVVHRLGPSAQPSGVVSDLLMHAAVSLGGAMAGLAVFGLAASPASARSST